MSIRPFGHWTNLRTGEAIGALEKSHFPAGQMRCLLHPCRKEFSEAYARDFNPTFTQPGEREADRGDGSQQQDLED